jgi:serine/threonine-protein kinase
VKQGVTIPPGVLLRVLADACAGLHDAHELRADDGHPLDVIHRDMSPHNILVNTKGVTKVIDFGIAKARDRMGGETNAGVLKGKVQYMAPEQALGRKIDRRADVWAVGATLYHLLTGRPPYEADTTLGTLHLLTSGRPPLPLPPLVPPAVAAVARKALTSAPDARYETAAALRDAMEAAMVEADIVTTQADVAAFLSQHVADRSAKRRQVIDIAISAAGERERVEAMLKPQNETTDSDVTGLGTGERTAPEVPGALRSSAHDIAPSMQTQQTPAGTVASEFIQAARPSRGLWVAVGGVAVAAIAGGAFLALAPRPIPVARSAPATPPVLVPTASVSYGATGSSSSSTPEPATSIPLLSLSELPKVVLPPNPAQPPKARGRTGGSPAGQTAPQQPKMVDDGF